MNPDQTSIPRGSNSNGVPVVAQDGRQEPRVVTKALEVATQNSDFLPQSFDVEEMRKDVELFEALYPLLLSLTQIQDLVDDTCMAVGSEAYAAALQVYSFAKASGQGSGLDVLVEEMGQRFARKPRKAKDVDGPVIPIL